jgi:hypothetical protein
MKYLGVFVAIACACLCGCKNTEEQAPTPTSSSQYDFKAGYPTKESAAALNDELMSQRATQTYLWTLPAVNLMAMKEGSEKAFGAGYNIFPVWKKRLDAKTNGGDYELS